MRYKVDERRWNKNMWLEATGDVVVGDLIRYQENVFHGSHRRPQHVGKRQIVAEILRDSYGEDKQQHTLTLLVLGSAGTEPIETGKTVRRKARNVYRNGTERLMWRDEAARELAAEEKHDRGDDAREARYFRRQRAEEAGPHAIW